jgi:hypothetical protein
MSLDLRNLDALVLEPRSAGLTHDHFVELYDDEAALVGSVRTFLSIGINEGEAAVVIATPAHREAIEAELGRTLDLEGARAQGLYRSLDAADVLSCFLEGDEVEARRCASVIGEIVAEAARGGRNVRVFGEMVALLWEAGNVAGALQLEDQWNELAKTFGFRLFCAYPSVGFTSADTSSLTGVCNRHSHVVVPAR